MKTKRKKHIHPTPSFSPRWIYAMVTFLVFIITTAIMTYVQRPQRAFIPEVQIENPEEETVSPTPTPDIGYIYTQTQIPVMSIKMGPEKKPATSWLDVLLSTLRRK